MSPEEKIEAAQKLIDEARAELVPRITLEELEGRTTHRTPGLWRVAPTSDYPPGEKPGINIDAGEHGLGGFVCEVCGPNPDEQMRADAYFIAHAPDIFAIAQEQRAVLQEAKAAMRDMLCGWKMIRDSGGEDKIYGIGWDRAQAKVEAALDKIP